MASRQERRRNARDAQKHTASVVSRALAEKAHSFDEHKHRMMCYYAAGLAEFDPWSIEERELRCLFRHVKVLLRDRGVPDILTSRLSFSAVTVIARTLLRTFSDTRRARLQFAPVPGVPPAVLWQGMSEDVAVDCFVRLHAQASSTVAKKEEKERQTAIRVVVRRLLHRTAVRVAKERAASVVVVTPPTRSTVVSTVVASSTTTTVKKERREERKVRPAPPVPPPRRPSRPPAPPSPTVVDRAKHETKREVALARRCAHEAMLRDKEAARVAELARRAAMRRLGDAIGRGSDE